MIFVPYFIGERARDATRLAPADVVEPDLPDGTAQERLDEASERRFASL